MSLDINELAALLHIHKATGEHGSSLVHIRDAVWERLKQINADHAPPAPEPVAAIEGDDTHNPPPATREPDEEEEEEDA